MKLLDGLRVLDFTRLYPGPFCTLMMADMGADVIKVESPGEGDYMRKMGPMEGDNSIYFRLLNRNKKSITLNLKDKKGVELFFRLAQTADVIVEGFRPGVMDSLGVGYQDVRRIKEDIIYCSISGYGQDGPLRLRAGHDINYIGLAGILYLTGEAGSLPIFPGVQVGDVGGGAQMALAAVLAALFARERGRGGQYIDVSMLDGLISWLPLSAGDMFAGNRVERGEGLLNGGFACYNVYRTADGGYMSLGALEQKFWGEFCRAVGRDDLFKEQYRKNQDTLKEELRRIFLQKSRKEWEEVFRTADACCEPILSLPEVAEHPQVKARKMMTGQSLGFPVKFGGVQGIQDAPAPEFGEHTETILKEAGVSEAELCSLREEGIL